MMALQARGIAVALLAGLTGLGSAQVAAQDSGDSVSPAPASLNPINAVSRTALKGFLERPLFDPSRRLPPVVPPMAVVEAPPPVAPPEPPPSLHLIGVIRGAHDMAIVQRDGGGKTIILRKGDNVGGWKVTTLSSIGVRLRNGSRAFDYEMFAKATSVGSIPADRAQTSFSEIEVSDAIAARNARLQRRTY